MKEVYPLPRSASPARDAPADPLPTSRAGSVPRRPPLYGAAAELEIGTPAAKEFLEQVLHRSQPLGGAPDFAELSLRERPPPVLPELRDELPDLGDPKPGVAGQPCDRQLRDRVLSVDALAAMPRRRGDQAFLFIEPDGGWGEAGPPGKLSYAHDKKDLDLKCT
jgi:hypothetical protein